MSSKKYDDDEPMPKQAVAPPPKRKDPFAYDIDIFGNSFAQREKEKAEQQMKKLEELARYMHEGLDEWGVVKKPHSKSKMTAKENLTRERSHNSERILSAQQQNDRIDKALEFISTLPFQEGDVAFHKDYGNVIVDEIAININSPEESSYYIIARGTKCNVPYKELVPISEATKILYSKK